MFLKIIEILLLFAWAGAGYCRIGNKKHNQKLAWTWTITAIIGLLCASFTFFA